MKIKTLHELFEEYGNKLEFKHSGSGDIMVSIDTNNSVNISFFMSNDEYLGYPKWMFKEENE